jgi:hypothetical protein
MVMALGVFPVDPSTPVGLFRVEIGDDAGVPNSPAITAEYEFFSDAAIEALIAAYSDSRDTAMAKAMTSMATRLITSAQDIQVDDIRIRTVERANLMLQLATDLLSRAESGASSSAFSVVPLRSAASNGLRTPFGTPTAWHGGY